MVAQMNILVFLQSETYGREVFSYSDDEQAFASLRRLLAESRLAFLKDEIERTVGIIVSDRQNWIGGQ